LKGKNFFPDRCAGKKAEAVNKTASAENFCRYMPSSECDPSRTRRNVSSRLNADVQSISRSVVLIHCLKQVFDRVDAGQIALSGFLHSRYRFGIWNKRIKGHGLVMGYARQQQAHRVRHSKPDARQDKGRFFFDGVIYTRLYYAIGSHCCVPPRNYPLKYNVIQRGICQAGGSKKSVWSAAEKLREEKIFA
jgi:hypothetical protein